MSEVYLARDIRLGKLWAVKEIMADGKRYGSFAKESIQTESSIMKNLDHPSLPRIVDILEEGDRVYIVMDYIQGISAKQYIERYGKASEKQVRKWALVICDVLLYLHSQKPPVIYRDMKPSNIMLTKEGNVKIIDFGIAREQDHGSRAAIVGTKGYAPPEQYEGQTDQRSDIYAFGMTLYYLLTGMEPDENTAQMPVRTFEPEISEGMEAVIRKCVQPLREDRYQNCRDLLEDLRHPEKVKTAKRKKRKIRRRFLSFVICIAFLIGGTGYLLCKENAGEEQYSRLMEQDAAASVQDRAGNCEKAAGIFPERLEIYLQLLEIYEESGRFGQEESEFFLALYSKNRELFDASDPDYRELNLKAGMMYLSMYGGETDMITGIQKAYPFFEENHLLPEDAKNDLSELYYRICCFYRTYIFASAMQEEAAAEQYSELFLELCALVREAGERQELNNHTRLMIYDTVFILIFDQREQFRQAKIGKSELLSLLRQVYEGTKEVEAYKQQNKELRGEILDDYEAYREAIERTYEDTQ